MPLQILITLWLFLFVGRGIAGTLLLWTGLIAPEVLRGFDEGILTAAYYVLLIASIVVYGISRRRNRPLTSLKATSEAVTEGNMKR